MRKFWKRLGGWGTALKHRFAPDIFSAARLKIAFLYLLMGIVILFVAALLLYFRIVALVQSVLILVARMLANPATANSNAIAAAITKTVNTQVTQMNLAVGIWVFVTLVISAYILAGITLWPIRRAMERQRRFIANVSHELRTPLSVMKAESEVALMMNGDSSLPVVATSDTPGTPDASVLPANNNELLETVKSNLQEIDRLSRITQFLLDFSNLENRMAKFEMMPVDLSVIAANAVKMMAKIATEKGVTLVSSTGTPTRAKEATVQGNPVALEEMTLNLIKNAVNYTPTGGTVTVNLFRSRRGYQRYGWITLSIQDTGIGIPAEDMPHLFEPFYRGKRATATRGGDRHSAGLGLAIVKELADLHKAAIAVKSVVGEGTAISVRFGQVS
jgi:signal transduction histidine kinase